MKRILLVEDNITLGKVTVKRVEAELEMPVSWAKDMTQAVSMLDSERDLYFAAVLDFVLPDAMNGEIIDVVSQEKIPSIVFTASINTRIRKLVWSKNVVDYIIKDDPNSLDYLIFTLRKLKSNRRKNILLVDDSPFFRKSISKLLQIHQYQLFIAENGKQALDILEVNPHIILVITDFNMPEMDGCQLTQAIRRNHGREDLGIIGISAGGDDTMAAKFLKYGANDFIIKQSFIREEFYCRVSRCIENIELIQQIKAAAIRDFLTGLYNRRYLFKKGEAMLRSADEKAGLGCAILDIDYFKKVNDTWGHDAGDKVLCHLSEILSDFAGDNHIAARMGGEEFCILSARDLKAEGCSPEDFCRDFENRMNRLRLCIQDSEVSVESSAENLKITVSIGISFNNGKNLDQMIKSADEALYRAKENGRNQVVIIP